MRSIISSYLATLILVSVSIAAYSADITWDDGGGDSNWSTAANWSGDAVPGSSDNVIFDGSTSNGDATIDSSFGGTVASVTVQSDYTGKITMARNLTVSGAFDLNGNPTSGDTWTPTGYTLSVGGDFTIASKRDMWVKNQGTLTLTGSSDVANNHSANNVIGTVNLTNGTTTTMTADFHAKNFVTGDSTSTIRTDGGTHTLILSGTFTNNGPVWDENGGSLEISPSTTTAFPGDDYNGAEIRITQGAVSLGGNVTCGTLSVTNSSTFDMDDYNLTCAAVQFGAHVDTNSNTFWAGSGTLTVTGSFVIRDSDATAAKTFNAESATIQVGGNWTNQDVFNAGTSTVVFNASSSTQTINPGGESFNNLTIAADSTTVTPSEDLDIDGNLSITAGTLDTDSTNSYELTITGTTTVGEDATLTLNASTVNITGTWDSSDEDATVNFGTSTLIFDGGTDHAFSDTQLANDIEIAASSTVDFGSGFAADSLTIGSAATVDFASFGIVNVDDFTVNGSSGNVVTLRSNDTYAAWLLDVDAAGTQSIAYADFLDCDARNGDEIDATNNGTDSGRNYNIDFGQTATFDIATCDSSDLQTVYLRFSEAMDETTAENTSYYTVSGGIGVDTATLTGDGKVVKLEVDSNVTIDTTTVEASSSILSLIGTAISTTTKTIVDGTSNGVADADAVTLELTTDGDGQSIVLKKSAAQAPNGVSKGTGEELFITAPGTTATTVEISQIQIPGGTSVVYFGNSGFDHSATVTTSGGTPNEASVTVRFAEVGASADDLRLRAHISGTERAAHESTAVAASYDYRCIYLADQRPVQQTITLSPAVENVQLEATQYLVIDNKANISEIPAPTLPASNASGEITYSVYPCGAELYCTTTVGVKRFKASEVPSSIDLSDCKEVSPCSTKGKVKEDTDGKEEGKQYTCNSSDGSDSGGYSVDLTDGEKKLSETDLFIPGRGVHFELARSYRSHNYISAMDVNDFGTQWRFSYAYDYLVKDGSGDDNEANYIEVRSGGSARAFVLSSTGSWNTPSNSFSQLTLTNDNTFEIRTSDGRVSVYNDFSDGSTPNANGRLISLKDRNDNELTVHYETIDPDGTASNGDEKKVVAYVVDSMGREIRYQYYAATSQSASGRTLTVVDAASEKHGRLAKVIDFKGDMDFDGTASSEDFSGQTNNRTVTFDYDSESNLVRVSSPAVSGTPNSNNFTNGKTTRYQYYTQSHHPGLTNTEWSNLSTENQDRLLHSMTHIWHPNEVQGTVGSNPSDSDAAQIVGYEVDNTDDFFGFVTSYTIGGENDNGVDAGGQITYAYTDLKPNRETVAGVSQDETRLYKFASLKVNATDRASNQTDYTYGGGKNLMKVEEYTNGLRTGEPTEFTTNNKVNIDNLTTKWTTAESSTREYFYNEDSTDKFQNGNMIRSIYTPDGSRGGDQDTIENVLVYEPIYNRPCLHVTGRGSNSADNDFTPPIAEVVTRTMTDPYDATKTLNLRYATVEYFDYQESDTMADDWSATSGSAMAGEIVDGEEVLATEVLLLRELNLPETEAGVQELRTRLSDNLTNLALGDLNGDNNTDPVINGNIVRTIKASPVIPENVNQHELEDDIETAGDLIDETLGYSAGGSNESTSGDRLQTIVTMRQYNDFGQLTKVITPEGNVNTYDYFPEDDPDGDGTDTPTPADSRTLDTTTGGYLKEHVVDDTRSYYDQDGNDKSSATFSNNNTDPSETEITGSMTYDDVGNRITFTNPRGIRTDYFVNELNQRVRTTRAADISGAASASPSDPLYNHSDSDQELTAFAYKSRLFFDYNDNVVLSQVEDRQNTSDVDGSGLGTLPSQATDTTPGLSSADSSGGDAYVDTLNLYDRLDNLIEGRVEVDSSSNLITKIRYDNNENRVLIILPAGNANSRVYDERDLVFEDIKGTSVRPTAGNYAVGDPTTFNRPGGAGTAASTVTYNYDSNENIIERVDADDTDSDSSNNSTVAGQGDVISYAYDGYDRQITITDPLGNKTTKFYDADSNVIRIIQDGDPKDDVVGTTGNKTLAVIEFIHDNQNRIWFTHKVLFKTQDHTPTRTTILTDGTTMDTLAEYLSDANSDTAAVPDAISGLTVIGRVTELKEYDRESRNTFVVQDDMDTYRNDYDGNSRRVKSKDSAIANGYSSGAFDPENIDGNTVERAYDDNDNVVEQLEIDVTDIANVTDEEFRTTFIYDSLDRRQTIFDNLGQAEDCRYDSRSNKKACADAQGPVNSRAFNRRGLGSTSSVTINDYGNVKRYIWDGINRRLEDEIRLTSSGSGDGVNIGATLEGDDATAPSVDSSQSGDGLLSTYYVYDGNSQIIGQRDDNGNTNEYIWDNQDRMLTDRKGLIITGTTLTVSGGDSGSFNVALRGAATTPVDTETSGTDITISYDKDSNISDFQNEGDISGNRSTMTYDYDALNRRKSNSISNPIGSAFIGTTSQTWEWDGLSRMTESFDNNDPTPSTDDVLVSYFYDSLSRKVEEEQKIGTTIKQVSCNFDIQAAGSTNYICTSLIYPDGRQVDATFDSLDRLINKIDNGQSAAIGTYQYIGRWRVGTLTFQNDTRLTHIGQVSAQNANIGFDGMRRIINHRWEFDSTGSTALGNGTLVVGFGYQDNSGNSNYDRMNNKLLEEKQHATDLSEVYTYDSAYRLTEFDRGTLNASKNAINTSSSLPGTLQNQDWTLDGAHNWNSNNHTAQGGSQQTENRTHSDFNEIVAVTGTPYGQNSVIGTHLVDKSGNLTDDGTLEYEWDASNRLREVTRKSDGKLIAVYSYDVHGRRFVKIISNGGLSTTEANGTTNYYYYGWQVIEERNGSDAIIQQYVYGNYIDEPWVLDDRSASIAQLNDGSGSDRQFYHSNTQKSIHALTDETGAITEGYIYDAYGQQTVFTNAGADTTWFTNDDTQNISTVSAVGNPYGYTGRRFDNETEKWFYRYRYYDSELGRFIGRDFLGYIDGVNLYASYFSIVLMDPFGLLCCIDIMRPGSKPFVPETGQECPCGTMKMPQWMCDNLPPDDGEEDPLDDDLLGIPYFPMPGYTPLPPIDALPFGLSNIAVPVMEFTGFDGYVTDPYNNAYGPGWEIPLPSGTLTIGALIGIRFPNTEDPAYDPTPDDPDDSKPAYSFGFTVGYGW